MVSSLEDRKIIELFFERSEQAIVELSNKYNNICSKVAFNILNNKQDTEECLNDAYLGLWNTIPPQTPNPLLSYVCRIVRNLAIKKYHKNTALKRNSIYDVALDELENCFPSSELLEDEFDVIETARIIDEFLETLDWENRVMFVRRYWYSDSIDDLAKYFKTSNHNISVRLSRTREKLKKHLIQKGVSL
ncbi:MAG: sigma-70 family RNA polymerase sigma factor [Ruminococcaceae bacterium]|nr:sigma-70 family RNA polymerase sigma factor [Oscillospiraceae bacterium]